MKFSSKYSRPDVDTLLDYTKDWTLHHAANHQAFASIPVRNSSELVPLHDPRIHQNLQRAYHEHCLDTPSEGSFRRVINRLDALARGKLLPGADPTLRVAESPKPDRSVGIALNAVDTVVITKTGWKIDSRSAFNFLPGDDPLDLPRPAANPRPDALDQFRRLLRPATDGDWLRAMAWLLAAGRPHGPHPILILRGPTGCGKSQAARLLRSVIDPRSAPLAALPSTEAKLQRHAYRNWIPAFDHIARLPPKIAEALCRLSSGTAYYFHETRRLPPILTHLERPLLLTVTETCKIPNEIAARAWQVNLQPLTAETRRTEQAINEEWEPLQKQVLGALCEAIKTALNRESKTQPQALPRLADAAKWAAAAAPALETTEAAILEALSDPEDNLDQRGARTPACSVDTHVDPRPATNLPIVTAVATLFLCLASILTARAATHTAKRYDLSMYRHQIPPNRSRRPLHPALVRPPHALGPTSLHRRRPHQLRSQLLARLLPPHPRRRRLPKRRRLCSLLPDESPAPLPQPLAKKHRPLQGNAGRPPQAYADCWRNGAARLGLPARCFGKIAFWADCWRVLR